MSSVYYADPESEEENVKDYVKLSTSILDTGEFYNLSTVGNSKIDQT